MFDKIQKLPQISELKDLYPIDSEKKSGFDEKIKRILRGAEDKKLLIVGPCSLDETGAIFDYLERLKKLEDSVRNKLFIVVRLYSAKPRSRGGFNGLLHCDNGIIKCRQVHQRAINDFGFAVADELLYPFLYDYFCDAVSYYAIGARTSQSQEHKFFASGIAVPVGFKNPVNGDLGAFADSIAVAREKNTLFKDGYKVVTGGNTCAHGILRGYTDKNGAKKSNFDAESIYKFNDECFKRGLNNVPLIIDFSHDNSGKNHLRQINVAMKATKNMLKEDYRKTIKGFMLESYINEGRGSSFGCSLTDGCLSFEQTQQVVLNLCEKI